MTLDGEGDRVMVWCVWTEWGEYSQFSRDLRGIFASQLLAEAHAAQLRGGSYDVVEVVEDEVLGVVPISVPYVRYAAHIRPDGTEDTHLGYHRGSAYSTWSNEIGPVESSRVGPWGSKEDPNQYIEVIGSDEALVSAEYDRLLVDLRSQILATMVASPLGMDLG